MNPIALAHKKRLAALNRVKHRLVGEDTFIVLLCRNPTTGAMDAELATIDKSWQKSRIRRDFVASQTEQREAYIEVFEVAADAMDNETADQVAAVRHGTTLYAVSINLRPSELQQYWRFQIDSTEKVPE